ncbi:dTDP-4-amino-4,6-dideoxy-D-glucose transaminase [mine drainage metagenome]|uniref:dTDP-4-amino-4,6-dideoxy-D-glucose transaminase n=1 Tax=mine drainage metagenome TaxID=410659 RepID=A0A1J5RMJ7_9ZZZZ
MDKKNKIEDLAIFGGKSFFVIPKSTSNLLQPDFEKFMGYSKLFLDQHQYTNNGPNVKLLEQRLAAFHQTEYCISFCSGFWAIALTISVLALKGKTEIVMPSLTYRRMADIAAWVKLKPHFCEVEPETLAMSAATVLPCINENTALILGVHPIVNCCDIDGLVALSKEKNIPLLFDSVESVYESTTSGKVGSFGHAEGFSLHACKLMNGFGGGYITTNDASLARQLALMRGFGFEEIDKIVVHGGMNAKLNEIHAAMALASLDDVDEQVVRNRQRYHTYKRLLTDISTIRLLEFDESHRAGYKNIVVELLDDWPLSRADTISILNAEKILARAYYSPPLHQKSMKFAYVPTDLPVTDMLAERFLNLPCGHLVSNDDVADIVSMLRFISNNASQINDRLREKDVN